MARNSEDRQETVDGAGELVQQDDKWYKQISSEEAFKVRWNVVQFAIGADEDKPEYTTDG